MTRTEKIQLSLLKPINPSIIIVLGIHTVLWGLWIFSPFWSVFTGSPIHAAMAALGSEYLWGALAVAAGTFIIRGAVIPIYQNIQMGAFIAFFHWFIISILYFIGDWTSTGGISALTFAAYSAIVWVNIKVNREHFNELRL